MQLKLDVKTLAIGVVLGAILVIALGAGSGSADADRFGIAVGNNGSAVVKAQDGSLYIVDIRSGMATLVLAETKLNRIPSSGRNPNAYMFNLSRTSQNRDR